MLQTGMEGWGVSALVHIAVGFSTNSIEEPRISMEEFLKHSRRKRNSDVPTSEKERKTSEYKNTAYQLLGLVDW